MTEPALTAPCPTCGKVYKIGGLAMHRIRAHEKHWPTRKKADAK